MPPFEQAAFSPAGAGRDAFAFGRHKIRISAEMTGGALGCFDAEVPPGEGPPPHIHDKEDEFFHVIEGDFAFWCEGARVDLCKGGVIAIPRGKVHRFQNVGTTTGHLLIVVTPGGFEGFFPAVEAAGDVPMPRILEIAAAHNLRFVLDAAEAA